LTFLKPALWFSMADYCCYCETRRPLGGTNTLVLNGDWIEFCPSCGDERTLTNGQGLFVLFGELFRALGEGREPALTPRAYVPAWRREEIRIANARALAKRKFDRSFNSLGAALANA